MPLYHTDNAATSSRGGQNLENDAWKQFIKRTGSALSKKEETAIKVALFPGVVIVEDDISMMRVMKP